MNQNNIKNEILSNQVINAIIKAGRWGVDHGSDIIEYFIDNELEMEYGDSRLRKTIIKEYIKKNITNIFNDIEEEQQDFLYRSLYLKSDPKKEDFFGVYWSSKQTTAPCVDHNLGFEYLLQIRFNNDNIDWVKTILSRLDYIHGNREKEFQLFSNNIVSLIKFTKIEEN